MTFLADIKFCVFIPFQIYKLKNRSFQRMLTLKLNLPRIARKKQNAFFKKMSQLLNFTNNHRLIKSSCKNLCTPGQILYMSSPYRKKSEYIHCSYYDLILRGGSYLIWQPLRHDVTGESRHFDVDQDWIRILIPLNFLCLLHCFYKSSKYWTYIYQALQSSKKDSDPGRDPIPATVIRILAGPDRIQNSVSGEAYIQTGLHQPPPRQYCAIISCYCMQKQILFLPSVPTVPWDIIFFF